MGISLFFAGICNGPQPGLSLSSEEMESEATPLCLENMGDKLPASLYLTAVPWDESIQETLSPQLSTGTAILGRDETKVCRSMVSVSNWATCCVCEGKRDYGDRP